MPPQLLEAALEAARVAGHLIRDAAGGDLDVRQKSGGPMDVVTATDVAVQGAIEEVLRRTGLPVTGEESAEFSARDKLWLVDPIDGTLNFVRGMPFCTVSIALMDHGRPLIGVISDPFRGEVFSAARGQGAYLDAKPLHASVVPQLERLIAGTNIPYDKSLIAEKLGPLFRSLGGVRITGSAALDLAYLACGRLDAVWGCGLRSWDIAAGVLLAEEAGAHLTRQDGTPLLPLSDLLAGVDFIAAGQGAGGDAFFDLLR